MLKLKAFHPASDKVRGSEVPMCPDFYLCLATLSCDGWGTSRTQVLQRSILSWGVDAPTSLLIQLIGQAISRLNIHDGLQASLSLSFVRISTYASLSSSNSPLHTCIVCAQRLKAHAPAPSCMLSMPVLSLCLSFAHHHPTVLITCYHRFARQSSIQPSHGLCLPPSHTMCVSGTGSHNR